MILLFFCLCCDSVLSDPVIDVRQRSYSVLAGCMRIAPHVFVENIAARLPSPIPPKKRSSATDASILCVQILLSLRRHL